MRLFRKKISNIGVHPDDVRVCELLDYHGIKTIIDIGANKGQYALRMRQAGFIGNIISFEPLAHNHTVLSNLAQKDKKWSIAPPIALGEEKGTAIIHVSEADDMSSLLSLEQTALKALPKSRVIREEAVTVEVLDTIFDTYITDKHHSVFVKIDTQGYEMPVLKGAIELIKARKIKGFQLELSLTPLYHNEPTFEEITIWLKQNGYEPHFIMQGYFSKKLHRQLQIDGIFFAT